MKERLIRFRSFWVFPLVAAVLLYVTFKADPRSERLDFLWLFPLGVFLWTLLEYFLHRFIFHINLANRRGRELLNASHLSHHAAPRDVAHLLVHTLYGFSISAILYGLLYAAFGSLWQAAGAMCGIWAGFLYYESVHYRVHIGTASSKLIARQRRAHYYHHFINQTRCFGVTSPLWDYVFRTTKPRERQLSLRQQ